jgi:sugar/nucleoside kinase (ribokinase family)
VGGVARADVGLTPSQSMPSMLSIPRVLIAGDVIDDIVVTPLGALTRDSDTTSRIRHAPGGSAANQAAWLASRGVAVRFVARVGAADVERHRGELEAFGVEAVLIADYDAPTGTIVVMLDGDGSRTMYTDRGANLRLTAADLPPSLLDGVDALHVNGYPIFAAESRSAVTALIPNLDEGRALTGGIEAIDVLSVLRDHYPVVALKLGSGGVLVSERGRIDLVPSVASSVVDPTGAGDAFCAGFLASWLEGAPAAQAAREGSALAAHAVATYGGRPQADGGYSPDHA